MVDEGPNLHAVGKFRRSVVEVEVLEMGQDVLLGVRGSASHAGDSFLSFFVDEIGSHLGFDALEVPCCVLSVVASFFATKTAYL